MGAGAWTAQDWSTYSTAKVVGRSTKEIYSSTRMKSDFDPKGVTRESCDSAEHPNSTPIIIGLDVTGSMGHILQNVAEKLEMCIRDRHFTDRVRTQSLFQSWISF